MKKSIALLLVLFTLFGSSYASAALLKFQITYTPTVGDEFIGMFTIDEAAIVDTNTRPETDTFSVSVNGIDWILGVDAGTTRLQINNDIMLSDATFDGQIFDTVGAMPTNQIFTHSGNEGLFNIRAANQDLLLEGSFLVQQIDVSAPATMAMIMLGAFALSMTRRRA